MVEEEVEGWGGLSGIFLSVVARIYRFVVTWLVLSRLVCAAKRDSGKELGYDTVLECAP